LVVPACRCGSAVHELKNNSLCKWLELISKVVGGRYSAALLPADVVLPGE
jgi:hypothetical protein